MFDPLLPGFRSNEMTIGPQQKAIANHGLNMLAKSKRRPILIGLAGLAELVSND
jgi:hypothetical protein